MPPLAGPGCTCLPIALTFTFRILRNPLVSNPDLANVNPFLPIEGLLSAISQIKLQRPICKDRVRPDVEVAHMNAVEAEHLYQH
jgi:hypothetical protein